MESGIILLKKLALTLTKSVIKEQTIKKFGKNIVYSILAILIMVTNIKDSNVGVSGLNTQQHFHYSDGINFEMVQNIDEVVYSVDRIVFGCSVEGKVGLNAGYGYSIGYFNNSRPHNGIDLDIVDKKIYSAISGTVISTSWDYFGGGNLLVIEGVDGWRVWYAHMAKIEPVVGQKVNIGDYVGVSGNTGSASTGFHLHISILHYGGFVDPLIYLRKCVI